jgi:hypothetical protein
MSRIYTSSPPSASIACIGTAFYYVIGEGRVVRVLCYGIGSCMYTVVVFRIDSTVSAGILGCYDTDSCAMKQIDCE